MFAQPLCSSSPDLFHGKYVVSLFAGGEQGVWYDPSDLSTMFQDTAGTTPVTGVEQPVGLMLDKSKGGLGWNGAKRVNLLRRTRQLQDTVWTKANDVTVTDNYGLAPDGTNTATRVRLARSSNGYAEIFQRVTLTSNLKVRVWLKALAGTPTIATTYDNAPNGAYKNIVTLSQEWTEYEFDIATQMIGGINLITWSALPQTSLTADFLVWNPDLRLASNANTLPKYQRVDADWPSTMPGNHATQTTTASRPVLSARVNLLQKTEQFDDAYWSKDAGVTVTPNQEIAPDGTLSADLISLASGSRALYRLSPISFTPTLPATRHSFWVKAAPGFSGSKIRYVFVKNPSWFVVDVTLTDSWQQVLVDAPPSPNDTYNTIEWGNRASGTGFPKVDFYLWGADIRVANESPLIPRYQRVNTATDYDTQDFPHYLRFDGVDDSLVTPSINFTSTDKMTVFAGVRKLSDAAGGYIVSLDGTLGTFTIFGPDFGYSNKQNYGFNLYGSSNAYGALVNYASPISNVLTASYDINGNITAQEISVRVNQLAQSLTSSGGPAGTGNFGSWPLVIGRPRSWLTTFNGRLYGLIVRGAQTDNLHLTNVERYLANKSGVLL